MSQAASQAWGFYREVAKTRVVWTVSDEGGLGLHCPFQKPRYPISRDRENCCE
jgi:hypothetical protein